MPNEREFKNCPFCAEQIHEEAIKCRFCGEWLESKPSPSLGASEQPDVVPVSGGGGEASCAESGLREDVRQEGGALLDREQAPPVIASTPSRKRTWKFTPRVLNWISCGLLAFFVITITVVVVLHATRFDEKAVAALSGVIGRTLICAGIFAWMVRKRGKEYVLLTFSFICACSALAFAYYFHVGRESAKQQNRQFAENFLNYSTNAMEFVQQGGTGSIPKVRLTGDPGDDAIMLFAGALMSGIGTRFIRMNEEIDALGKRQVFEAAVLISKETLVDELRKRSDSLKVLEKYRGGLTSIAEECKSKFSTSGLRDDQRREILQGFDICLKGLEPKYASVLDARAKKDRADEEFLSFLSGAFKDYRLKDGKIMFANAKNIAKYEELANQVTDACAELDALLQRFMSEAEAGKAKIRADGGIDSGVKR